MDGKIMQTDCNAPTQPIGQKTPAYIKCFNKDAVIIGTCMLYAREDEEPYFELGCLNGAKFKFYFVHKMDAEKPNFTAIRTAVRNNEADAGEIQLLNYKFLKGIPIFGCPDLGLATTLNPETLKDVYYILSLTLYRMDNTDNPMWQYLFSISYTDSIKK